MSEKVPQTFKNHARFDPLFHFFMVPVAAITMIRSIWSVKENPSLNSAWIVIVLIWSSSPHAPRNEVFWAGPAHRLSRGP